MDIIAICTKLHNKINHLNLSVLNELLDIIKKLESNHKSTNKRKRKAGTMPGLVSYMAQDFFEPLPSRDKRNER